ncbi:MAG TPA: Mu transposase C-terminal domain-containing protein [Pyrinomonadaceae bacterium]|nr:Mu transposase C-terminal domain-containing protein [Pyrinomonadaceae bacterium]
MSEELLELADSTIPRIETLSEAQIKIIARNQWLVSLIDGGLTPRKALKRLQAEFPGPPRSTRWAQKLYKRYKSHGAVALLDNRCRNKQQILVLTDQVQKLTLAWWFARRAAGAHAIFQMVVKDCKEQGIKPPSYESIKKFLAARPQHEKLVRAGKIDIWDKQHRPVVRQMLTNYSNERWQIDHCSLPIWIREMAVVRARNRLTGEARYIWIPRAVWLTLLLDAHSRAVAGFYLSKKAPDAWSTSVALRHSILRKQNPRWRVKGIPSIIQPDCGKDFLSHAVAASLAYLGIILDHDPPRYPQMKGRIERFFRTLNTGCLRALPGHHAAIGVTSGAAKKYLAALLTRSQLVREIERFIVEDYHQRVHSETGRKPIELWGETVRLRMPTSQDALDNMLLKSDVRRKIRNTGIDFHLAGKGNLEESGGRYWSPGLVYHAGGDVVLRYNPEDLASVLVYSADTGEYIDEAWIMGEPDSRFNIVDIKRTRSQFRRGLIERQREYAEEIYALDRRAARQAEWDEARKLAEAHAEAEAEDSAEEPPSAEQDDVERLLAEFERRDRGL